MNCNPDDYRDDIAALGLTPEQENELLTTLWEMMRTMVEIGWGVENINKIFPALSENADQAPSNLLSHFDPASIETTP